MVFLLFYPIINLMCTILQIVIFLDSEVSVTVTNFEISPDTSNRDYSFIRFCFSSLAVRALEYQTESIGPVASVDTKANFANPVK